MKKVLLATSALTMMAGAASAEIALSGSARMGLVYSDTAAGSDTFFSSRVRIVFTASGETDTGLSFGASMRADQSAGNGGTVTDSGGFTHVNGTTGTTNGDSTVYISGAFGKLTMGDVGGAADALVGQVSGVGYGPYDDLQEIGFIGTHKTAVYYEYSTGALTFGLGSGQLLDGDRTYNIAAKYSTDAYSVALGWETDTFTDEDRISLSGSASFGSAKIKAKVVDSNVTGADTAFALSVDYTTGATTLTGFYTDFGNNNGLLVGDSVRHIGIGASYDLGGGATVAGGIVRQDFDTAADNTFADVGLKFSF